MMLEDFVAQINTQVSPDAPMDGDELDGGDPFPLVGDFSEIQALVDKVIEEPGFKTYPSGGRSASLGLLLSPGGGPFVRTVNEDGQLLFAKFATFFSESLKAAGILFNWTSVQFNAGTVAGWHVDSAGYGDFVVGAFGDFVGGEFEVMGQLPYCLRGKAIVVPEGAQHRSLAFRGSRYSFVAFKHLAWFDPTAAKFGGSAQSE